MAQRLKTALLVLLVALTPVRAIATVTIGFCAMHGLPAGDAVSGYDGGHRHHHGTPHRGNHEQCNACAEHCTSAALSAAADLALPVAAGAHRIAFGAARVDSFIPEHLDPPPLAR